MKQITFKPIEKVAKEDEWWKVAGKEMSTFFGKPCYWIFWKHSRERINRAWSIATKEGDRDFTHFLNNIIKF